jgi:hypothetical protein
MAGAAKSIGATPILDSATRPPAKKKSLGSMLSGFVLAIPYIAVLISASNNARQSGNSGSDFVFPTYILAIFLAIVIHELGHLAAGWIVGFRFDTLRVGPISLYFEYGKLKVSFRKSFPAAGYAGMRVDRIRRLRKRLLIFVAGGPIANLLSAAATALFLAYTRPKSSWLAAFCDMFWMISTISGVINLMPLRVGVLYADGARILMLLSSVPRSRRWISQNAIVWQSHAGVRPKAWKRTWLEAAGGVRDGSVDDFAGNWAAYLAANDRKDIFAAAVHLERCLEGMNLLGPLFQDMVALEAAVFSSWFREDAVTAQKWLVQVKKLKALPQLLQSRAQIAMCCGRREFGLALSFWQEGIALIEKLPSTPLKVRFTEGFLEWRDEIREREGSHASTTESIPAVL